MASDDGSIFVYDDGITIAKFFNAAGDLLILWIAGHQLFAWVVRRRFQVGEPSGFNVHVLSVLMWSVQRVSNPLYLLGGQGF